MFVDHGKAFTKRSRLSLVSASSTMEKYRQLKIGAKGLKKIGADLRSNILKLIGANRKQSKASLLFLPLHQITENRSHDHQVHAELSTSTIASFTCEFCVEDKHLSDSFNVKGCSHFYCQQCIAKYVVLKLQENLTSIGCPEPGCRGMLDPNYCRPVLPKKVFDRWRKSSCENVILVSEINGKYFYCPFKDCSALTVIQQDKYVMKKFGCPHCKREICLKCKAPWHTEFDDCRKFQKLRDKGGDKMVKELAKKNQWRRCPKCKYYVAKEGGCNHVTCRCKYEFCYKCGTGFYYKYGDHGEARFGRFHYLFCRK